MSKFTKLLETQEQSLINTSILSTFSKNLNQILFFDIETTGFSPKTSICYLIGGIFYKDNQWHYMQLFAENEFEEAEILKEFTDFIKSYSCLIHFNGDGFDLPFLAERCKRNQICDFNKLISSIKSIDLFKVARNYRKLIQLENYKQKTIEMFLGIHREDQCNGGELIKVYKKYCIDKDLQKRQLLLLHNHDDICGMPLLLPILQYQLIIDQQYKVESAEINHATDFEGNPLDELLLTLRMPERVPTACTIEHSPFTIRIMNDMIRIRVPVYSGILKHFYSNYKDYYYLPEEDEALHKSVASYVDKSRRKQANASNCYSKINGVFLPQYNEIISPVFRQENTDKMTWFQIKDDYLSDTKFLMQYVIDIMNDILQ